MKCFSAYRIHLHTGVVIVVRAKIDDNSGDLARARDTIIVFYFVFIFFGAVTGSGPTLLPPRYILFDKVRSKAPAWAWVISSYRRFRNVMLQVSKGVGGGGRD